MRKLIIFFLALLMVIPVLSSADSTQESKSADDSKFIGLWVDTDYSSTSDYQYITAISVRKNGKAFFVSDRFYDFSSEPIPDNRVYIWKADGNKLSLISSDTGKVFWELYLFETDQRYLSFNEDGRNVNFEHVPHIPVNVENTTDEATAGTILYPGQYIIGTDIPAGDYRFEFYQYPSSIYLRKDPDSTLWSSYAEVTSKSPVYAKLSLHEGNRLDIVAFPLIIMEAKPVFGGGE